jgi:hypothetical protein
VGRKSQMTRIGQKSEYLEQFVAFDLCAFSWRYGEHLTYGSVQVPPGKVVRVVGSMKKAREKL